MKIKNYLAGGILLGIIFSFNSFSSKKEYAVQRTDITDAENQKLIKTAVTSKGGHSGNCINISIENKLAKTYQIIIPAGTVFIADNSNEQNILVTKDIFCSLKPNENKKMDISGYCCEHNDHSPDEGSTFTINKHKDDKVKKLVTYLNEKNYPDHTIQDVVWCVANGSPVSNIYIKDTTEQRKLRKYVCELTGQKDTWYTTPQNHVVTEDRQIRSEPVEVKGMIKCSVDGPTEVNNAVYDSEGNVLFKFERAMKVPKKCTFEYEFHIRVGGWKKGKYYVLVTGGEKELLKQEFEI